MNRIRYLFLFVVVPLVFLGDDDYSAMSYWDFHPLHIGGNIIQIGRASIHSHENGHLHFRKNNVFLNMLVPISRTSYFFPRVDVVNFSLAWNKNPKFNETHFQYTQFGLMFYSTALEKWRWILRADYNLDLKHFSNASLYSLFSALVWGKYELNPQWNYHVGAMTTTGLASTVFYPIVGIDYSPSKQWTLEAIFPIMYSIQYKIDSQWRLAIKGRPLKERFRVGSKEREPRAIFNYTSIGTELNVRYERFLRLEIELYAGYNFGGKFYIKNEKGNRPLYTQLGGAPYGGASLDYGF